MAIQIKAVDSKSELRKFIRFPYELFKGCRNWVPALEGDEFDTLDPKKNAAYEYCDAKLFLALDGKEIVGRVAAIINRKANELWGEKTVRFGWIDFIESQEVCNALLDTVKNWGKEHGCTVAKGPWGFTDMDKEGLLVEGFEHLSPFTCLYNYPYYGRMIEAAGFEKEVDWTQKLLTVSEERPKALEMADAITERYGLHIAKCTTARDMCKKYGMAIFHMYNTSFKDIFEFTPLTDTQIKRYLQTYVPILNPKYISICLDRDENPVGFAFCVPSLSKAVQKCKGRLFPFGFINILKALRKNDTLEALMIGVLPKYHGKGASVLMCKQLQDACLEKGINHVILNPQLEENIKAQTMFNQYTFEPYMRRRAYKSLITCS